MLHHYKIYVLLVLAIAITACGISRRVAELEEPAETAFKTENYRDALNYYEEIIELKNSRDHEISGKTWYRAGVSAWELEQTGKAIEYLEQAEREDYTSETGFFIMARAYREIDNLSLEITSLENYLQNYPDGKSADEMRIRLFDTYLESNNLDGALELWHDLEDLAPGNAGILESWFILNRRLDREDKLKSIALKLYDADNKNVTALEYLGHHYFWLAENRYQEEMDAYENNRTRKQYRQLLDAFDLINEHFRISRDYFEQLMDINPRPAYAEYLGNIYLRFGNDEKAEYYHQRSLEL